MRTALIAAILVLSSAPSAFAELSKTECRQMATEDSKLVAALRRNSENASSGSGKLAHDLTGVSTGEMLAKAEAARKARLAMAGAASRYADALEDLVYQFQVCAR